VWAAHKLLPLNYSGYGQVIARSWGGARKFSHILETLDGIEVAGATIQCQPLLLDPDFNMICMAFNVLGNHDLDAMNELNQE
ncbi:tyrosine decarboxylase, partial [Escherichia coli]